MLADQMLKMTRPCLRVTNGGASYFIEITKPSFTIGRHNDADLRLCTADSSRHHAQIVLEADGWALLRDHRSRYETFVNDQRIVRHLLTRGDQIRFGRLEHEEVVYLEQDMEAPVGPYVDAASVCLGQDWEQQDRRRSRCPACTEPNNFLERELVAQSMHDFPACWLWSPPPTWIYRYRCRHCGYTVERRSSEPLPRY